MTFLGTGPGCFSGALHWARQFYVVHYEMFKLSGSQALRQPKSLPHISKHP